MRSNRVENRFIRSSSLPILFSASICQYMRLMSWYSLSVFSSHGRPKRLNALVRDTLSFSSKSRRVLSASNSRKEYFFIPLILSELPFYGNNSDI